MPSILALLSSQAPQCASGPPANHPQQNNAHPATHLATAPYNTQHPTTKPHPATHLAAAHRCTKHPTTKAHPATHLAAARRCGPSAQAQGAHGHTSGSGTLRRHLPAARLSKKGLARIRALPSTSRVVRGSGPWASLRLKPLQPLILIGQIRI